MAPGSELIDHLIILMMENRSFDHYLGALNFEGRSDVNGLGKAPPSRNRKHERGPDDPGVQPWCLDDVNMDFFDPPHEWPEVRDQIHDGEMDGFVSTFHKFHLKEHQSSQVDLEEMSRIVMGYYTRKTLPVLYALADQFTVCDAWHSSFPGSTHPNRVFAFAGHCGDVLTTTWKNGFKRKPRPFWANWGDDLSWRVYKWRPHDLSTFSVWPGFLPSRDYKHLSTVKQFVSDCQRGNLPRVSIIEPSYTSADDHPPHDPRRGQQFIGHIVNVLAASKSWSRSALVLTYDEHGGFYDHVAPPALATPSAPPFHRLGVRVPTIIVSPYARAGAVASQQFEHASLLKSISERWNCSIPEEMTSRVTSASSIWPHCFDFEALPIDQVRLPPLQADWTARLHPITGRPITTDLVRTLVELDHIDTLGELGSEMNDV